MSLARSALAATLLGLALNASAELSDVPSGAYSLDKTHGYITFTYSHLGFSTPHVGFRSFDVALDLDNENVANSAVDVTIDATSIDSRVDAFDGHLNGQNFFDTANHPTITFKSASFEAAGEDKFNIVGDLTIKGVTKPVTLDATLKKAANHPMKKTPTIGVTAGATVSRSEWGLSRAVPNVGDEITIHISVELTKSAEE
ncbi:MAG: YceI family protein [Gammaproteobacteria bacterium]|nr:YceI family protein [Gammaproteobacteria bacterium]